MDGTLNSQPKHDMFDASLRTTQTHILASAFHSTRQAVISLLGSRKKIVFVSAASLLTFSIPLALAVASDSPSRPANAHNEAAASGEGSNNNQNGSALSPDSRSKTEVNLHQNTSSTSSGNTHSSSLTINGKSVAMPENGRTHHIISDGQQTTNIDIESYSQQSANGSNVSNNSSSSVNIQSNSNQLGGE